MKKLLTFILALLMLIQPIGAMADGLITATAPKALPFKDVTEANWFYSDVKTAYEMGLINGKGSADTYKPDEDMSYAEAVKLAACMHQLHTTGKVTLTNGAPNWYDSYVEYCKTNGIIDKDYTYTDKATRAGYMEIFAKALPDEALKKINIVPNTYIPDVKRTDSYGPAVYKLYEAGIVAGVNAEHECSPKSTIKRREVAAIIARMMVEEKRVSVGFEKEEANELTFGIFADVHALANNKAPFANVMNNVFSLSDEGKELDGLVLVGDIVYLSTKDSMPSKSTYDVINTNEKFKEVKDAGKLVYAMGNHEFPLNNTASEVNALSKQVFTEQMGFTPEKDTVIGGYHFITAGPNSYSNDLNPDQEKFIMDSVKAALEEDDTKPVFLIIHQPIDNTTYGTGYNKYSDTLESFIKSEPRLVVFSAHMHYPSSDPQTIFQVPGGATFVQTTSIMGGNGARTPYVPTADRHDEWPCQGMMMRINTETNVVTLKRFYSGAGLPEYLEGGDWTLDIPAMTEEKGQSEPDLDVYKYTAKRAETSKAPFFKESDKITVTDITETSANVSFPIPQPGADGEDNVAAYYKIEVTNAKTGEVLKSHKKLSDYFLKKKKTSYSISLVDLPAETTIKFSVIPVNPWYVEGEALTTEFTTPVPKFREVETDDAKAIPCIIAEAIYSGSGTFYPSGAAVPEFVHIPSSGKANVRYVVEIPEAGKYRVFFNGGAEKASEMKISVALAEVSEKENGDMKVTVVETIYDDSFFVVSGSVNTVKSIPCADVEIKKPGTYSFTFKKYATPSTINTNGIEIVPIIE